MIQRNSQKIAQLYLQVAVAATKAFRENLIVLAGTVGLGVAYLFAAQILGGRSQVGGVLMSLVGTALLSIYYSWIIDLARGTRLKASNLLRFEFDIFVNCINVGFVFWLALWLVGASLQGEQGQTILLCIHLGIAILCNTLPEVIMFGRVGGIPAIDGAFNFVRENWIEWFIPFLLILSPWILLVGAGTLPVIATSPTLLPPFLVVLASTRLGVELNLPWIGSILGLVIAHWFMLFRAKLFQKLEF